VGQALEGKEYTHVFDNFAKDVKTVETVATKAKEWNVKNYCYVSSAGMRDDPRAALLPCAAA
jgi:hypothetical protein